MARFDEAFAQLQTRLTAALGVIAQYPDIAAEVRDAVDGAQDAADVAEGERQDDARANVVAGLLADARAVLAAAAPRPTDPPADPEEAI